MAKFGDGTFVGASGSGYTFTAYTLDQAFNPVGAVYVITKRTPKPQGGGNHDFIYIGQTGDLSERFDNHHKAACFKKNGANCICVHVNSNEQQRFKIETDLCRNNVTPCNG